MTAEKCSCICLSLSFLPSECPVWSPPGLPCMLFYVLLVGQIFYVNMILEADQLNWSLSAEIR